MDEKKNWAALPAGTDQATRYISERIVNLAEFESLVAEVRLHLDAIKIATANKDARMVTDNLERAIRTVETMCEFEFRIERRTEYYKPH